MTGGTLPLFAYGTLRDPEFQRELFGREFPMRAARVHDYTVFCTPTGYFAASRAPGATIAGVVVEIDGAAYEIADAWEDLTVYDRIETGAHVSADTVRRCNMYVARVAVGTPVEAGQLAAHSRASIIADIRRFRAQRDTPSRS